MYENVFSGGNTGFIRQYFRTITPTDFALHGFHWNYFQSQWIIQSIEEGRTTAEISNVIFQCFELHQKKKKKNQFSSIAFGSLAQVSAADISKNLAQKIQTVC